MNIFKKFKASLRFLEAVRKADKAHEATGERYYVMPMGENKKQLIILDRRNFRKLKHKGYVNSSVKISDLERECFYCTSYRNGKDALPTSVRNMKLNLYYKWSDNTNRKSETEDTKK